LTPSADSRDEGTRRFYAQSAMEYARETQNLPLPLTARYLEELLSTGGRVLDLGCGAGRDLRHMASLGLDAFGIDRSEGLARIAAAHSGKPCVVADFATLPFADGTFDGVYAVASLLHASAGVIPEVLREIRRTLRKDGLLIGSVKAGRGDSVDGRGRFTRYYDVRGLTRLVEGAGFEVVSLLPSTEHRSTQAVTWLNLASRRTDKLIR
jgi:SAM-dependent methyltransferase